ncbi:MAG: FCD domain-containing protein [Bacteroidales bacterium]|nr:FCD domain-containing protein [Bacteroidales bacterium]
MEDLFSKIGTGLTLSQRIERKVEEAIRQKKLMPGDKMASEKELCAQFAVSRTALRHLFYDLRFDSDLILKIIEVRRLFEPEIARLAASNRKEEDIRLLRKNQAELVRCNPDNTQLEVDLINRFHKNIAKATGNPIVIISMEPVYSLLPRMRNLIYGNIEGEKDYTVKYQADLLNALEKKDGKKAWDATVALLDRNMEIYNKYFAAI